MRHRTSLLVVLAIGLAAILAGPGQALLPHRTLLPLDFLHQALLPWANDVRHPDFHDHYEIDAVQEYLPLYQFQAESLRRGEFPTWNPFNRGGTAYLDNPVPIPFHPLKLLLRFLTPDQVFDLLALVHFALAFLAMSLYLRSLGLAAPAVLFGALCWAFCGYFVMNFVHERAIGAYGLTPLILMLAERVYAKPGPAAAVWLGLALGLSLLICDPTAIIVYLFVLSARFLALWFLDSAPSVRAAAPWLCAAGVIAFGVAAPNLLSTLEGLATNVRVFDYAEKYSVPGGLGVALGAYAALAVSAIHPYVLGSRDSLDLLKLVGQTITMTPFAGGCTLLLALLATRRLRGDTDMRWLLLLLAAGLLLLLPPVTRIWSTRNVILLTFVLCVSGALGMNRFFAGVPEQLKRSARLVAAFTIAVWTAFILREGVLLIFGDQIAHVIRQGVESRLPGHLLERYAQWSVGRADRFLALQHVWNLPNAVFLASLTLLAVAWQRLAVTGRPAWRYVVLVAASASPLAFMLDNVNTVDMRRYPLPVKPDYLALRGADPGPPRITIPRQDREDRLLMPSLLPQFFHLAQVQGYGSLFTLGPAVLTYELPDAHPLYEVLGVNYFITARNSTAEVPAVYRKSVYRGEVNIYAREPLVSRFRVAHHLAEAASRRQAAERARADQRPVATRDFYLTQLPAAYREPQERSSDSIRVVRDDPVRIELEATAEPGGLLVIGDSYYPGWRATVDGEQAKIHCVDGSIQGVWLPSGRHRVVLEYVHWPSRVGLGLQLLTASILAGGLVLARRR